MTVNPDDADPVLAADPLAAIPLERGRLDPGLRARRDMAVAAVAALLRSRRALNALRQPELVRQNDHHLLDVVRTPTAGLVVIASALRRTWLRGEEVDEEPLDFREFDNDIRHRRWKVVDVLSPRHRGCPARTCLLPATATSVGRYRSSTSSTRWSEEPTPEAGSDAPWLA